MNKVSNIFLLLVVLIFTSFSQENVIFQNGLDGYAGCKDVSVMSPNGADNYLRDYKPNTYPKTVAAFFRC